MVLIRPELDQWKPGEHNGTFRGNNFAFVTATAAIDAYWSDDSFSKSVLAKGEYVGQRLEAMANQFGEGNFTTRGSGLFRGINCIDGELAGKITTAAFKKGLIIETSGADDQVVKIFCPLTTEQANLEKGLDILEQSIKEICAKEDSMSEENCYFDDVTVG